jgi:hypothetical protein
LEERGFLGYKREGLSVGREREICDVGAVDEDLAFLDGIEPFQKGDYASFTAALRMLVVL